jgi:2'-5' RNA ligase
VRCFIALCLPEEARRALAQLASTRRTELDARGLRFSWTRPEGYHLTLAFLGEIDGPALDAAASSLDAVAGAGEIAFRFAGLGGFPMGGGLRVLFAKIDEGGKCAAVYRAVNEALAERARAVGLGALNPEWPGGRPFAPHITLARASSGRARVSSPRGFASTPRARAEPPPAIPAEAAGGPALELAGAWTIGHCALYKSELRRGGSVYTEIRSVEL